jgi:hypothetical protein
MKKRATKKPPKAAKSNHPTRPLKRSSKSNRRKSRKRTASKAKASRPASHPRAVQQIKRALERFSKAQMGLSARGLEVLSVAHALESSAVEKFKRAMLVSLVQNDILQDLNSLHRALSELNSEHAATSEALLNWLSDQFDLTPHLRSGQVLDLSADQLSQFTLLEEIEPNGASMIALEVVHPGWKASGKLVVAPSLKRVLTSQPSESADPLHLRSTP